MNRKPNAKTKALIAEHKKLLPPEAERVLGCWRYGNQTLGISDKAYAEATVTKWKADHLTKIVKRWVLALRVK